ncbi:PVC-type heme-binding CxxCH protein [Neorhodopirellula pilleata]|uniref:Cytochrome c domain-containing protein n=1 Tax=Neorhodopirellula pilleata TaxID=2714738 RepID=A0A5C6ACQ6_9BACT|nr:PVC-type heme-binding CxxCH protein [Neorhodopirellula pilleata]TWT97108.1 hypothetical protein Pla100_22570 [Neorhodopirellula pilleata]
MKQDFGSRLHLVAIINAIIFAGEISAELPPSPRDSLGSLVVHEGVRIELAACEPQVIDPIALRFDASGRMWIVEMRDYPTGPIEGTSPDGRIRVLTDSDHDGFFETATDFAQGLVFPTGLQPWQDGVIVTLAGRIEFMADRDGDGQCDHREVWFEGFAEDNEQLRANHPTLGPDGLVTVANGLRGGNVRSVDPRWPANESIDLRTKDFVFDPRGMRSKPSNRSGRTGYFGAVSGNSQFGMSIDDFANRVGCSNRNPAIETLFPLATLARNQWSTPRDALHDIAASAADSHVNAITQTWTTSHTHQGQFSAACGVTVGLGTAMPTDWRSDLVVCEPTSHAVQRQRIERQAIGRRSHRITVDEELLASRDRWFRPVDTTIGVDGALYVVDMCRAVIEHPNWAPAELKHREDERWGNQHGRVWRIVADESAPRTDSASPDTQDEWLDWLSHSNPTQRQLATVHLLDAVDDSLVEKLRERLTSTVSPEGFARMLWLLAAHRAVESSDLEQAINHQDFQVRRVAVSLIRSWLEESDRHRDPALPSFTNACCQLLADRDPWVRHDALGLAGDFVTNALLSSEDQTKMASLIAHHHLTPLADSGRSGVNATHELAVACLPPMLAVEVLNMSLAANDSSSDDRDPRSPILHQRLARTVSAAGLSFSLTNQQAPPIERALVSGWCEGHIASRRSPKQQFESLNDVHLDEMIRRVGRSIELLASDPTFPIADRLDAIQIAIDLQLDCQEWFGTLLLDDSVPAVTLKVLPRLLEIDRPATLDWLAETILELPGEVRAGAIDQLIRHNETTSVLLNWIDSERLPTTLVSMQQIERLKKSRDPAVADRAEQLFGSPRADRLAVVASYQGALDGTADLRTGREIFRQHCGACHLIEGIGTAVGPDISDSRTKTPESILTAILDPNAAIDAGYVSYRVLTIDGDVITGSLLESTGDAVTLQEAGGKTHRIVRNDLESLQATGMSLMPVGLEQVVTVDQMRHLIGYLKGWRYLAEGKTSISFDSLR